MKIEGKRKIYPAAALLVALIVFFTLYYSCSSSGERVVFSCQKVVRGDMQKTISATGTVEPEELVNVGAQINGMITTFGEDVDGARIDYGSKVTGGMILAKIDDSLYLAELGQAEAQKLQAQAAIKSAEANLAQSEAKYELAQINYNRTKMLRDKDVSAQSDYDNVKAELGTMEATLLVNKAAIAQAQAELVGAEAAWAKAKRNLEYCVISSPVDGVIIDRRVNVGQTVVASMNAPSLFLIAKDLRRMEVWVSVNEADIGEIKVGQRVLFTVDSYPDMQFEGEVQKVRLNATMSQNVVTFVVEIGTDNSSGILLPYMTANVKFILEARDDVLMVPNSALRFTPSRQRVPEKYHSFTLKEGEKTVWVLDGRGELKPVAVTVGMNDGVNSEITAGALDDSSVVVTGMRTLTADEVDKSGANSTTSPFLPKMPSPPGGKAK